MKRNTSHQQKIISQKENSLSQNEKGQGLNLKVKLQDTKWFINFDNWIKTNLMTR